MEVLVAYASAHGSTGGVARRIAERLTAAGHHVDLRPAHDVDDLTRFDAIVLGSAIHSGRWLTPADDLLRRHAGDLASRRTWCFSVCSIGETTSFFGPRVSRLGRRARKSPPGLVEVAATFRPRGHRWFAGAIGRDHWGRIGNVVLRACGGTFGDHRDWDDVRSWADGIAAELARPDLATPREVVG
jgi:menaquinone-dependent protoporphyrinogen oxidase